MWFWIMLLKHNDILMRLQEGSTSLLTLQYFVGEGDADPSIQQWTLVWTLNCGSVRVGVKLHSGIKMINSTIIIINIFFFLFRLEN